MNKTSASYFLLALFALIALFSHAQTNYEAYTWEENRSLNEVPAGLEDVPLYAIDQHVIYHYVYEENGDFVCYKTIHKIYRVNNDEALSSTNRIYIPLYNTIELMAVKARAHTPDGRVVLLDEKNIKELEDEESGYRIFAIEGAEIGGEIEFYYTQKISGSTFGSEYFQNDFPILNFTFQLITPENLEYEFAVYNDDGEVIQTDATDQGNYYSFSKTNIPALYEESFSAYTVSKKRIEFRLSYNSVSGKSRLNTWSNVGKRLFDQIAIRSKSEEKALLKLMKTIGVNASAGWDELLKAEHFIKTNYFEDDKIGDVADKIDFINKNKFGSSKGYTKVYVGIAEKLGIPYEIVVSCDRFDKYLDPEFENWDNLDDYLIYFPTHDKYLSPEAFAQRIGTIPAEMITNNALFISPTQIQNFIYPVSRIEKLPEPDYKSNFDNLEIKVDFNQDLDQNEVEVERSFRGYMAQYYKASMLVLEQDDKEKMLDDIVKYLAPDAEIDQLEVTSADMSYSGWNEPFAVKSAYKSNSFIQRAGNTILFKVGELIGPQAEMYQERERLTEVVNTSNRGYFRKIEVNIPEGYSIGNPDDIVLKKEVVSDDKTIYIFDATYETNGQKLIISIDEWYDKINYPIADFEAFRAVVNAAADWNKIVLVLNK